MADQETQKFRLLAGTRTCVLRGVSRNTLALDPAAAAAADALDPADAAAADALDPADAAKTWPPPENEGGTHDQHTYRPYSCVPPPPHCRGKISDFGSTHSVTLGKNVRRGEIDQLGGECSNPSGPENWGGRMDSHEDGKLPQNLFFFLPRRPPAASLMRVDGEKPTN